MDVGPEGPTTPGWAEEAREDTVEIEPTGEEQLGLSQSAKAAQVTARPIEPKIGSLGPARESFAYRRTARVDLVCNTMFAVAAFVGIAGAVVWRATDLPARAPAIPARVAVVAAPTAPAPVQRPLVRESNPFDATEVFEFPAETTESQAREAIAELLLQRARDRRAHGLVLGHAAIRDRARGTVQEQPELFVTTSDYR
jgi:hypothetical protein